LARHSVGARRNLRSRLILARRRAWLWALWTDRIARVLLARNGARLRLLRTDRITRVLLARSGTRSGLFRVGRGSCGGSSGGSRGWINGFSRPISAWSRNRAGRRRHSGRSGLRQESTAMHHDIGANHIKV